MAYKYVPVAKEDTYKLIDAAQNGDRRARDLVVDQNIGLVKNLAMKYASGYYEPEDLMQVGFVGLVKAIDRFDTGYNVMFSTYAVPMITGEIKRFLRDDGLIKVSRNIKENGAKIKQARERLQAERGRDITLQELSEETGMERTEIVMALEANGEVESIYKTYAPENGKETCLVDRLPQEKDSHEVLINHMLLEQLLKELKQEERQLIQMRYFEECTQMQVAEKLGISQVQVSRMEKKILLSMRKKI